MFVGNSFGKTMDILHRSMDVTSLRRNVIANNISNADTPNFKRTVVSFESELKRALDAEKLPPGMQAFQSHEKHTDFTRPKLWNEVAPRRTLDYWTLSDNNGNNVDLEEEMMLATQNQMSYDLMTRFVSSQFSQVKIAVR